MDRFQPPADSRPEDQPWPAATWPPADVVLSGRFVELRPSRLTDAAELFAALDHDDVWRHVAGRPATAAEMSELITRKLVAPEWFPWTVRLIQPIGGLAAGAVIGTTSYLETSAPDARTEIGSTTYTPGVWGTVVNPEAKLLLLRYAFEELGMGRVQLKTDIRNHRSQQAIARLGARFEGVLRRYQRRADGTVRDTVLFAITAEDWPEVRERLAARLAEGVSEPSGH